MPPGQPLSPRYQISNFLASLYINIYHITKNVRTISSVVSPDKILGTPVGQPYSLIFQILKPCCTTSHPYLPYPQILEQSV